VLALSANESSYGGLNPNLTQKQKDENLALQYGNYFGLHGKGPEGTHTAKQSAKPGQKPADTPLFNRNAADGGFEESGTYYVNNIRKKVPLTDGLGDDPKAFFEAMHKYLKYAALTPSYADDMVRNDTVRGPYELVKEAIEQLKAEEKL
jgi:hypothetical protein